MLPQEVQKAKEVLEGYLGNNKVCFMGCTDALKPLFKRNIDALSTALKVMEKYEQIIDVLEALNHKEG